MQVSRAPVSIIARPKSSQMESHCQSQPLCSHSHGIQPECGHTTSTRRKIIPVSDVKTIDTLTPVTPTGSTFTGISLQVQVDSDSDYLPSDDDGVNPHSGNVSAPRQSDDDDDLLEASEDGDLPEASLETVNTSMRPTQSKCPVTDCNFVWTDRHLLFTHLNQKPHEVKADALHSD